MSRRPILDRPMPLRTARCSKRSALRGERGTGRTGSGTRSTGSTAPVSSNSGSHTSSCCSKRTATSWPIATSAGSHPTMLVVRCTRGSSASATLAIDVGRVEVGQPAVGVDGEADDRAAARHRRRLGRTGCGSRGRSGTGGWTSSPQSAHPWIRSVAVGAGGPEPLVGRGELRERAHHVPGSASAGRRPVLTSTSQSNTADMLGVDGRPTRPAQSRRAERRPVGRPARPLRPLRCDLPHSNIDVNVERHAGHRRRLALVRAARPLHQPGPGRTSRTGCPRVEEVDGQQMWVFDGHPVGRFSAGGVIGRDGHKESAHRGPDGVGLRRDPRRRLRPEGPPGRARRVRHRRADHLPEHDRTRRPGPRAGRRPRPAPAGHRDLQRRHGRDPGRLGQPAAAAAAHAGVGRRRLRRARPSGSPASAHGAST